MGFSGTSYGIDWGDGTIETLSTTTPSHTYGSIGDKTVKITGGLQRFWIDDPGVDDGRYA